MGRRLSPGVMWGPLGLWHAGDEPAYAYSRQQAEAAEKATGALKDRVATEAAYAAALYDRSAPAAPRLVSTQEFPK